MAKSAILSRLKQAHISRGDDPPYPPVSALARGRSGVLHPCPMAKTAIISGAQSGMSPGGTTPRTPRCPRWRADGVRVAPVPDGKNRHPNWACHPAYLLG